MIMSFGKQLVRKLTKPVYIIQYLKCKKYLTYTDTNTDSNYN